MPANALTYGLASFESERLAYITKLYGEEVHILVGPGISSLEHLRGRKIAIPPGDGNAEFTAHDLLGRFGIETELIKATPADAIDEVRSGSFAALLLIGGKPMRLIAGLPKDGSLRLLALPGGGPLDGYSPAGLSAEDYPTLVPSGQTIDTVSVSAVLVAKTTAKSDPSNRRIARFVPAFFDGLSELAGPQWHPKWAEVNLAATVAGISRFPAAKEWLDRATLEQMASVRRRFDEFLGATRPAGSPAPSPRLRRELFEQFMKWSRKSIAPSESAPP